MLADGANIALRRVRHDLRPGRPSPLWFVGFAIAAVLYIVIADGFAWKLFLAVPVLGGVIFVAIEIGYRRNNYAIFHTSHVDLRQVDWGDQFGSPKLSIPHEAIWCAQVNINGLVEVGLDLAALPEKPASRIKKRLRNWEATSEDGIQGTVILRAKEPYNLAGEFNRRVESRSDH